jgi:hypothetical protein
MTPAQTAVANAYANIQQIPLIIDDLSDACHAQTDPQLKAGMFLLLLHFLRRTTMERRSKRGKK